MRDLTRHFPHERMRPEQETAIQFALAEFLDSGKKFVIVEAGTGVGKSAIGVCVARYLAAQDQGRRGFAPGSYFLTTQKVLQEQYLRDFGPGRGPMREIKGSGNYTCTFNRDVTCEVGLKLIRGDPGSQHWKACSQSCVYRRAKTDFVSAPEGVTNFSYFLTEASYLGNVISPREFLVIDECHNVETALSGFVEVTVSERFARSVLKLEMPELRSEHQAFVWTKAEYLPRLEARVAHINAILGKFTEIRDKIAEILGHMQQLEQLQRHMSKVKSLIENWDSDNWIVNFIPADGKSERKLEFKAVDVARFSNDLLFKYGRRVMLMSATVINREAFCASVGIPLEEASFISIPSPFPPDNRPVFFLPAGRMTMGEIDRTLPGLCSTVEAILEQHSGDKGIIHTHSYKIAKALVSGIKSKRLLLHNSFNRDEILRFHAQSPEPTVIVSPSSTEGLDLKEDLSRFQVICKLPYPYLGDKLVKKRMTRNRSWYSYQTAKTIVQSLGRSIRSDTDYAVSYILDSDWESFLARNPEMFSDSFKQTLN